MNLKKSNKANLEKQRSVFFRVGVILSLSFVLLAFEWAVTDKKIQNFISQNSTSIDEEMIDITEQKIEKPIKPNIAKVIAEIEIKKDDEKILEIELAPTEVKPEDAINLDPSFKIIEPEVKPYDYVLVEDKPVFGTGDRDLLEYLAKNTDFCAEAVQIGLKGTVHVRFVISKTGKVQDVEILRGIHPLLDNAALKAVENMPNWKPGKQRGVPVPVSFIVPIKFNYE